MLEEKVHFNDSKNRVLCGILSIPDANPGLPIVILCHGLNSDKNSNTNIALKEILARNSVISFRFDFFAHGESEGNPNDRTVGEFVDDVLCAILYLKNNKYSRIGIMGASFGGIAAVIAASKTDSLNFMALKSPGMGKTSRNMSNYKDDFENKYGSMQQGTSAYQP